MAVTVVQQKSGTFTGTSGVITLTSAPTAGNLLVAFTAHPNFPSILSSITSTNTTWNLRASGGGATWTTAGASFGKVFAGAGAAITINTASSLACAVNIVEFTGILAVETDGTYGSFATTNNPSVTFISTSVVDTVMMAAVAPPNGSALSAGPTGGYTAVGDVINGTAIHLLAAYRVCPTAATYNVDWTVGASGDTAGVALALQQGFVVIKSLSATYNLNTTVSKSLSSTYNISQRIPQTLTATWGVKTLVQKGLAATYNVTTKVVKNLAATYNIVTTSPIAKALTATYNVSARLAKALSATWGTTQQIAKILTSTWSMNSGFSSDNRAIVIWPANTSTTGIATHLDIGLSSVEITSDTSIPPGYNPASTDIIPFASSLNDLNVSGDNYFQINRNSLTHVDLTKITGIRFRLRSLGNIVFKAQNMRMIKQDEYSWDMIDIDTKRKQYRRSVPRNGGTEPTTATILANGNSIRLMSPTRPKNFTYVAKFNSGHLDATNKNILSLHGRADSSNNRLRLLFESTASATTLKISDIVAGTETPRANPFLGGLVAERDYFLVFEAYDGQARASIYQVYGAFYGTLFATTGWVTVTTVTRGYLGYDFAPYNYDFFVDYMNVAGVEFGRVISVNENSVTPAIGATVAASTSGPVDLTEGLFIAAGDAVQTIDSLVGIPTPSLKFVRDGTNWQGGYMTESFILVGDPKYLVVEGDIFPVGALQGDYRVVFIDKNDSVGFIGYIRSLRANQWNHFSIPISANFAPSNYRILVHQTGFYDDTFYVDNLKVNHLSVAWDASPNGGTDWYPFLTAIDTPYSGTNFVRNPDVHLKVRGLALSDTAWIAGYEIIPRYQLPGHSS